MKEVITSVSKTVTATALFAMLDQGWIPSVNELFWPILAPVMSSLTPAPDVATVTMGELLTMMSRLPKDGTLYTPGGESTTQFVAQYPASEALLSSQLYARRRPGEGWDRGGRAHYHRPLPCGDYGLRGSPASSRELLSPAVLRLVAQEASGFVDRQQCVAFA